MVPDDNGLGFGVGFRAGMRLGRTWEPQVGLSRITTNGVTYTVGGIGFYYVAQVASRFAFYMGPQAAVLVPECSRGCNYASSGTAAQTDLGLLVSLGARVEFMRWFAMLLEGNAGVARLTEPFPVLYLGAGAMVALGL